MFMGEGEEGVQDVLLKQDQTCLSAHRIFGRTLSILRYLLPRKPPLHAETGKLPAASNPLSCPTGKSFPIIGINVKP